MSEPRDASTQATAARSLVRSQDSGILSTQSKELPGYPFGSVTPYVMMHTGRVAVFVSAIAEHTANMRGDSKVCLTVTEQGEGNQQALSRVTLIGDAAVVPEDSLSEVQERYFSLFPEARQYSQAHPFEFFWIEPRRVRYIAGFGQIFWVEPDQWSLPSPEWSGGESRIVDHMNEDHRDVVHAIAERRGVSVADGARMVAVDVEGCHIQAGGARLYVPFTRVANTEEELRSVMIELARAR